MHMLCKITKRLYPEYRQDCPDSGRTATPQQQAGNGGVSCHFTPEWCLVVGVWAHWRHAQGHLSPREMETEARLVQWLNVREPGKQQQEKHSLQPRLMTRKAAEEAELSPSCWTNRCPDLQETVWQGLEQADVLLPRNTTAFGDQQEKQNCVFKKQKHCLKCFMALLLIAKCLEQLKCPNWR